MSFKTEQTADNIYTWEKKSLKITKNALKLWKEQSKLRITKSQKYSKYIHV